MMRLWHAFTNWLERGDLVPFLVIASGYHYVRVLWTYDPWWVAVPIGLLVDLGHFRAVLIAVRYGGERKVERFWRWAVAVVMTGVSFGYHLRFYWPDVWLAIPMPLLIAVLAYFDRKDAGTKRERMKAPIPADAKTIPPAETDASRNGKQIAQKLYTENSEISLKELAKAGNVSVSTACRWRKEWEDG